MKNYDYNLFVGIDISKGKADAAVLAVPELRSVKPRFLRKKLSFKFIKSDVVEFLNSVRKYSSDQHCLHTYFALEVTGIYSTNVYSFIKKTVIAMKKSISLILISLINGGKAIIYPNLILWMLKLSVPSLELMMMSDMFQILSLKTKMDIKILRLSFTDIIRLKNSILRKLTVSLPFVIVISLNFSMFLNLNQLLF